jgi:hypothetical protein
MKGNEPGQVAVVHVENGKQKKPDACRANVCRDLHGRPSAGQQSLETCYEVCNYINFVLFEPCFQGFFVFFLKES